MTLVFASNNAHKLAEVRAILSSVRVLSLSDIHFDSDIPETGTTLEANSLIKAQAVYDFLASNPIDQPIDGIFSDDTGLEIAALNGAPGVYTARWAGIEHADADNRAKALRELQAITDRRARFRTVITIIRGAETLQVEGIVNGHIAEQEYGAGGFGYDPIFVPEGHNQTFAQLPPETKNSISHRARALYALKQLL